VWQRESSQASPGAWVGGLGFRTQQAYSRHTASALSRGLAPGRSYAAQGQASVSKVEKDSGLGWHMQRSAAGASCITARASLARPRSAGTIGHVLGASCILTLLVYSSHLLRQARRCAHTTVEYVFIVFLIECLLCRRICPPATAHAGCAGGRSAACAQSRLRAVAAG